MHEALGTLMSAGNEPALEPGGLSVGPTPIQRKARLVMRDPQQAASPSSVVSELALPSMVGPASAAAMDHSHPTTVGGIVENARRTAENMLAQTRAACEQDREAAQAAGYEAGFAEGMMAADNETASLIATAEQIGLHVAQERQRLLAEAEGEIVDLAIAIAQRVVNAAIDVKPEYVVDVCRGAMRKAFQRETLVVRAHPDDLEMLRAAGPQLAEELGGVQHLEFIEERRVNRGSLIVRTPAGEIDATFEGKTDKIVDSLRELVRSRAAERRLRDAA